MLGVNLTYRFIPDLAALFATNYQFWDHYEDARLYPCEKWTNNKESAQKYRLNYVDSVNKPGLSAKPGLIHHGHSSGYCAVNLAYLMGAKRILLLGFDMKFAPDYDGYNQRIGSSPRHFFGEYHESCLHWPKVEVKNGVHVGLLSLYRSIAEQNLVEIINCSPDSAIDCFPKIAIDDV
jgi:hypothetical protein